MATNAPSNGFVRHPRNARPQRSATTDSSGYSEFYDDESELESTQDDMTRIIVDAALFRQALHVNSDEEEDTKADGEPVRIEDDLDALRPFVDLVGRDLPEAELAATERLAKMAVSSRAQESDILKVPEGVGEPVEDEHPEEGEPGLQAECLSQETFSHLPPEEVVNVLIKEFGSLTTFYGDQERFIAEHDGAYFQEVVRILTTVVIYFPLTWQ